MINYLAYPVTEESFIDYPSSRWGLFFATRQIVTSLRLVALVIDDTRVMNALASDISSQFLLVRCFLPNVPCPFSMFHIPTIYP